MSLFSFFKTLKYLPATVESFFEFRSKKPSMRFQRFFSNFRLLPFMPYLVLERKKRAGGRGEKKHDQPKNKHTHVQSNVHHIFKHISKSSDFEIISQNKFSILSHPFRFFIQTVQYMYMSNHEGPKATKINTFFAMSSFKVVISMYTDSNFPQLIVSEGLNGQALAHSVFFFLLK